MTEDIQSVLLEPYTYICNKPGKDVRGILMDVFQSWLKIPEEKLSATLLHTAMIMDSNFKM